MKKLYVFVSLLVALTMLLAACAPKATPTPVATVPPVTLGTADDPLVMALAPSANTETLMAGGEAIAAKITELTGYAITTTVPTNYAALIEAMGSGNAQIGWLPPAAYIVAHAKGYADVAWSPCEMVLTTMPSSTLPMPMLASPPTMMRQLARTWLVLKKLWPSSLERNPAGPTRYRLPVTLFRLATWLIWASAPRLAPGCRVILRL